MNQFNNLTICHPYQPMQQPHHMSPATDPQHSYLCEIQAGSQTTDH